MRLPILALAGAGLLFAVAIGAQTAAPDPTVPASTAVSGGGLPEGPGRETLLRVCSACHAPEIVTQQRHTEKDWHDLVEMMAGNGAQATDAEFAEITAYLAKSFPAAE